MNYSYALVAVLIWINVLSTVGILNNIHRILQNQVYSISVSVKVEMIILLVVAVLSAFFAGGLL